MEGNLGETRGSLWQGCSKRGLTKPSSLVRELGIGTLEHNLNTHKIAEWRDII